MRCGSARFRFSATSFRFRLPPFPTSWLPGSPEKVVILQMRAGSGVQLFDPADAEADAA